MATTNAASGTKAMQAPGLIGTSGLERLLSEADDKVGVLLECVERLSKLTGEYRGKVEAVERAVSAVARKVGSMEEARSAHASLAERLAARGNVAAPPPQFPPLDSHIDVQQQYVDRILGSEKEEVLAFLRHKVQGGAPQGSLERSLSSHSFVAHMEAAEARAAASVVEYASDGGSSPNPRWRVTSTPGLVCVEPWGEPVNKAADKAEAPAAAGAEGAGASKRKSPAAADKAEAPAPAPAPGPAAGAEGASKRKSIEAGAKDEPPAKAIRRVSTAGGEDEAEPSKAMRRSESKPEARAAAKLKAVADHKSAAEFEEALQRDAASAKALQREAASAKGKSAKAQETPTRQMLNSDEYFRHHVARELAEQYLHEKGVPKSLKVVYPFLTELDLPEGNHRHRGSTGLAGALAVATRYIGTVVDIIIMREADSPRSDFDKIFPFYGSNWAQAQNKFNSSVNKNLYSESSAYQELCRETARMSPQIKGFLVMSIDKFRVQKAFGGPGSLVLGLTKKQHKALAEFQRFKQVIEYLLDKDNEKDDGRDGEDVPNGSPPASGPADSAPSETAPGL